MVNCKLSIRLPSNLLFSPSHPRLLACRPAACRRASGGQVYPLTPACLPHLPATPACSSHLPATRREAGVGRRREAGVGRSNLGVEDQTAMSETVSLCIRYRCAELAPHDSARFGTGLYAAVPGGTQRDDLVRFGTFRYPGAHLLPAPAPTYVGAGRSEVKRLGMFGRYESGEEVIMSDDVETCSGYHNDAQAHDPG